jgi:uracil-DNA glycosylase
VLGDEFDKPHMARLREFLVEEKRRFRVYPPGSEIFAALDRTPFEAVRVVVLGQDPYHGPGQAHGLCFSVRRGVPLPPSLENIFRELATDLAVPRPSHGDLTSWAEQGVLLLNATLTVREHQAASHQNQGWELFTDRVVAELGQRREGLVFLLWGTSAQRKAAHIDRRRHLVLESPHPSPLSAHRGFFGCRHFSRVNAHLVGRGQAPIEWGLASWTPAAPRARRAS